MLRTDDIVQQFAERLVDAIDAGASRAAIEIYRQWRVHLATSTPRHGRELELRVRMRELLAAAAQ